MIQENREGFLNAITSVNPFEITDRINRADKLILFDTDGNPTYVTPSQLPGSGLFDYVVDQNGTGTHTTIQDAVDAAQVRGEEASILILAGDYVEDITIISDRINLFGVGNSNGGVLIEGTITISPSVTESVYSLNNFRCNGIIVGGPISGGFYTVFVSTVECRTSSGVSPFTVNQGAGGSAFIELKNFIGREYDDAIAALRVEGLGACTITAWDSFFLRNNTGTSALAGVDCSNSGGGTVKFNNCNVTGFVDFSDCNKTISIDDGSVAADGVVLFDFTNNFGIHYLLGGYYNRSGGGDIITTNANIRYGGIILETGSTIDNSLATKLPVDGITLVNDGGGGSALFDDGTYKAIGGGGDMLKSIYDVANVSEQLAGLTASQSLTNKSVNGVTLDNGGAATEYLDRTGNYSTPASGTVGDYISLENQQASGVDGGTATLGSWTRIILNTEVYDAGGHCVLASNKFTLAEGDYRLKSRCIFFETDDTQTKLVRDPDGAPSDVKLGSSEKVEQSTSNDGTGHSVINAEFSVAGGGEEFDIQYQCSATQATNGQGVAAGYDVEVYHQVELWKVG